MTEDRFTWNPEPDEDGKTGFTMQFPTTGKLGAYCGRAAANKNEQTILAARWLGMMTALRKSSRFLTEELVREAWFACIGIPTAQERSMVERAREIVAAHIGPETLAQIYREAA